MIFCWGSSRIGMRFHTGIAEIALPNETWTPYRKVVWNEKLYNAEGIGIGA
jgi:hypothetical protein